MSEQPTTPDLVQLVLGALEAANRRDLDAVMGVFAADAVFEGRALGDVFRGHAAIRAFVEEWIGTYDDLEYRLEEGRDLGNGIVFAVVVQSGHPAGSAGHVGQREGWVIVWERDLIARITFCEVEEGRAAAERLAETRRQA